MINLEDFSLRRIYGDILKGVSSFDFNDTSLYIKHSSLIEQSNFDKIHLDFYEQALSAKLPREKDKLKELESKKLWLSTDDTWLETNQLTLDNLKKNRDYAITETQRKEFILEIEKLNNEINEKLNKKFSLLGVTADSWASQKYNEFYLRNTLYSDRDLTKLYFKEDYDEEELEAVSQAYVDCSNLISPDNIKKLASSFFFQGVFNIAENVHDFFGKPSYLLTYFQVQLYRDGRDFKHIYSQGLPPPDIKDPYKIVDWFNNKDKNPESSPIVPVEKAPETAPTKEIQEAIGDKKVLKGEDALKLARRFFG